MTKKTFEEIKTEVAETQKRMVATDEDVTWMIAALHLHQEGQPSTLAKLILSGDPVPACVRPFLASVIKGEIKLPDKRGKANAKLPFEDVLTIRNGLFKIYSTTEKILIFADQLADERQEEVIDLRRYIEKVRRDTVKKLSERFNVPESTIRQYHEAKKTKDLTWCIAGKSDMTVDGTPLPQFFGSEKKAQWMALESARKALADPESSFDPFTE